MSPEPPQMGLTVRSGRVKHARRLTTRAFRAKTGEFLAEGPQAVREALNSEGVVLELFITAEAAGRYPQFLDAAPQHHLVDVEVVTDIADAVHPQGVVARCRSVVGQLTDLPDEAEFVVACSDIRDPGNLGAVIRVADAAGADAVVLLGDCADATNPKVVRATAGSLFHLPVLTERDTLKGLDFLSNRGMQILAADGGGDVGLYDESLDLVRPTAWVMGNEAWGVPEDVRGRADMAVSIPIFGSAESLNLATAAAVCLYASATARMGRNR